MSLEVGNKVIVLVRDAENRFNIAVGELTELDTEKGLCKVKITDTNEVTVPIVSVVKYYDDLYQKITKDFKDTIIPFYNEYMFWTENLFRLFVAVNSGYAIKKYYVTKRMHGNKLIVLDGDRKKIGSVNKVNQVNEVIKKHFVEKNPMYDKSVFLAEIHDETNNYPIKGVLRLFIDLSGVNK